MWKFDGANSLGLLTDLASLRVVGSRMFGPVHLATSLGALYDWHGQFATGEAAAHIGLYLPGFQALKIYVEALGRGFPPFVKKDALLAVLDGQDPIHPQGLVSLGLSFHPHARVDLGVSVQRGFGGLSPWAVTVQFLTLSIGKTYQGRAATPVAQLAADVAKEAAVELKEFLDKLPIDPQLDEDCQILDNDNVTVLGHFGKKTQNGYYCEQDGFLVPIRHDLLRDKQNTRLCRDDKLQDCLLERRGKQWFPVHRPRLDGTCRMIDSDGTVLGNLGEPTTDGKGCRYQGERANGRYGAYTQSQELPIGAFFHTDADRTAVCVDEAMRHCFMKPPAGRHTLAWGNDERASTALLDGYGEGLVEQGKDLKDQATAAAHAVHDVATGKVKLNTVYGEAKQAATEAAGSVAALIKDPDKRAAVVKAAQGKAETLKQAVNDWKKKPPEQRMEDALRQGGRLGAQVTTAVLVDHGTRAVAQGVGLANAARKGAEVEAAMAKTAKKGTTVVETVEQHADRKALPPAPEPRGLLSGRPAPVKPPEPGRLIVDPKGNVLIEPLGGSTHGNAAGTFVETRYPNGSPAYQRHEGHPKTRAKDPHGHHMEQGSGPGRGNEGPSLDRSGNRVPDDSADAHWPVKQ